MPRRDGTGPLGNGPIDGRGLGFCTKTYRTACGLGLGAGLVGLGLAHRRGFGRRFANQRNFLSQKDLLTQQKEYLLSRINSIEKQMKEL